ncbi:hypothetical protein IMY05_C4496000300 [Salix suchowensis]|nr:hypothetical protein IMY05_C4496000300 [Salix suchowensis]
MAMLGGVRVAKVSLKSYLLANDAGIKPTRKRLREDDGRPSNYASTSPGRFKVARTHEEKEIKKRRERLHSEHSADSAFSSALAQHLAAALQRSADDEVEEAVHVSIPPPKLERRRRPEAVAQPAHKLFDARDFAPSGDRSAGLSCSSRPTRPRDVNYGHDNSGALLFHDQSHRHELGNWHADRQRHKDFQRGHNNQNGHSSYQHRRNNKSNWYNNDRQYHDNHTDATMINTGTETINIGTTMTFAMLSHDTMFAVIQVTITNLTGAALRRYKEITHLHTNTSRPTSISKKNAGEQAWEDGYEQVDDESGQSTPHSHRVASLRNDEDTQSRRTLSPQALTLNLTYNPWD